jgi:hypothetical protein
MLIRIQHITLMQIRILPFNLMRIRIRNTVYNKVRVCVKLSLNTVALRKVNSLINYAAVPVSSVIHRRQHYSRLM